MTPAPETVVVTPYQIPEAVCWAMLVGPWGILGSYQIGPEICALADAQAVMAALQIAKTAAGKPRFTKPLTLAQVQVAGDSSYWIMPAGETRGMWYVMADNADGGGSWSGQALCRPPNFFQGGVRTVGGVIAQQGVFVFNTPNEPTWLYQPGPA